MAKSGSARHFIDLTLDDDDTNVDVPAVAAHLTKGPSDTWTKPNDAGPPPIRSRLSHPPLKHTTRTPNRLERASLANSDAALKDSGLESFHKHTTPNSTVPYISPEHTLSTVSSMPTSAKGSGLLDAVGNGVHSGRTGSGSTDIHRQKRRKLSSHGNAGLKLKSMNGAPTLHTLRIGLNSRDSRSKIPTDLLVAETHSLHITRAPDDEVALTPATTPLSDESHAIIPVEPELQSSDFEKLGYGHERDSNEDISAGDADDRFLESYRARKSESRTSGSTDGLQHQSLQAPAYSNEGVAPSRAEIRESVIDLDLAKVTGMAQRASTQLADSERAGSLTTDSKRNRQFTAQDNDLMVYLKEVKGLGWGEIMQEFPDRTKGVLNTHYCRKIKGNNWMLNRLTLELPPKYAAEAEVLWPAFRKRLGLQHSPSATVPLRHEGTPNDIQDQTFLPQPARPGGRPRKEATTAISLSKTYPSAVYNSSSDYDSAPRQGPARPQRSVASVDYTWPRRRRRPQTAEDFDEDIVIEKAETPDLEHLHGSLAVEDDVVLPVDEPMDLVFDLEDARLAVTGGIVPYLSFSQRKVIQDGSLEGEWDQIASRGWQGTVLHVDFSREEMETVEDSLQQIVGDACQRSGNIRKRLRRTLFNLPEPKLVRLSQAVRRKLQSRDVSSIDAFIQDAAAGKLSVSPHIQRIGAARPKRTWSSSGRTSTSSLLRHREFGLQARRGWSAASRPLSYSFRNNVYDTLGPTLSYTGASGDVTTVAWSPDGLNFAAGAVCVTDRDSMQYNRPNNLLYGDVVKQTIHELAEHRRERKRPESGPNSSEEMHVSQDPYLYYTVSSVAFSADGDWMFAAGYDHTVTVWHTRDRGSGERFQPKLFKALEHKAKVDIIAVSQHNTLATAANRWEKAIKVCTVEGNFSPTTFSSTKGHQRPDLKILPTALKFEPTYGRLLLAGFGANRSEDRLDTTGDICLWDVQTQQEIMVYGSTANIFDVAWAPNRALTSVFAVGCVASGNVNRGTRSLVRLYDGRGFEKRTKIMEAECPALDMNDVVFCPYDENLIAAGCTSGHTYVWDLRKPDQWLYRLQHGKSLMPLDEGVSREVVDTGVRFLSWGDNATRLYTGSSDGVVKVWDVARAHQDVFVRDLVTLNSGIMSGAFSPDNSRLLLGEVDGSVNVLEVGNNDRSVRDMEKMTYVPYKEDVNEAVLAEHGTEPAAQLLASGEMVNVPFGGFPVRQAVQGPNYRGPFDTSADASYLRSQARKFQLGLAETSQSCDVPSCGNTSILRMTAEERGDSGRSVDRIPDELRKLWSITESEQAAFHGKSKCQNPACGRPARPKVAFGSEAQKQLCERCSFGCFRCGGLCRILNPGTDDKVVCQSCLEAWEIGALGYEAIDDDVLAATTLELPVPQLSRWKRAVEREKERDERKGTSWGDELNALSDYYFGLTVQEEEDDY